MTPDIRTERSRHFPVRKPLYRILFSTAPTLFLSLLFAGCGVINHTGAKTPPTVAITAAPAAILAGGSSTLTVTAANATAVTVTGSDGSSYTLPLAGGTQAVSPMATATYTATATGAGGSVTATAMVTVNTAPAPTVTITASPTAIQTGQSSTLTVAATNATTVTVTGTDGSSYTLAATGGTQTVSPAATTTYTATAAGNGQTATATAQLTVSAGPVPTVTISANPTAIFAGNSSTLTVTATNATAVTVTGTDGSTYTLAATGGTQTVSPTATTTYTATASGAGGNVTATAIVTLKPAVTVQQAVNHVIFMLQENHTFDNYFGMLNPYRVSNNFNVGDDGVNYAVDGIDDKLNTISNEDDAGDVFPLFKLTSTCIDDDSSDWLASFGDINRYYSAGDRNQTTGTNRILDDGFVHNAEGYANSCIAGNSCSGTFTGDTNGEEAMGYYDQDFLNYYYYMASQYALSDRWFSPVASKSIDNRIATFSGGTTQGLVKDPGNEDHLPQLAITTIFSKLNAANVSWKIYYTVTQGFCLADDECTTQGGQSGPAAQYPATDFESFQDSFAYLRENPAPQQPCSSLGANLQPSSTVGDSSNSFCIDPTHIAPLQQYYIDLQNDALPSFVFIEAGYANNDEHPGSGQAVLTGQYEMSTILNAFMSSTSYADSVFFFAYDEGGGPYDHVPPVPGHSNQYTDATVGAATTSTDIPDIAGITVNPDTSPSYFPCLPATPGTATTHCDLSGSEPGTTSGDIVSEDGFAAQIGFRVPNFVVSPFARKHYVSHIPFDHTAVIKFVEDRFIGDHNYMTARDAAQPNLLDLFDFNNVPWATPPTPPAARTDANKTYCTPDNYTP